MGIVEYCELPIKKTLPNLNLRLNHDAKSY